MNKEESARLMIEKERDDQQWSDYYAQFDEEDEIQSNNTQRSRK